MGQGPGQILAGGLVERLRVAGHQVETIRVDLRDRFPVEIASAIELARLLAKQVRMASRQKRFPIVLAGNCMAAVGAIAGLPRGRTGLVWLDAHADLHTPETTRSGFLDGMALATVLGRCWAALTTTIPGYRRIPAGDVLLLGARDVEEAERVWIREEGFAWLDAEAMAADRPRMEEAIARLGAETERVHLHVDLDVLDPERVAPANGFAPPGGLEAEELLNVTRVVSSRCRIASVTVAGYDPSLDRGHAVRDAALGLIETLASV